MDSPQATPDTPPQGDMPALLFDAAEAEKIIEALRAENSRLQLVIKTNLHDRAAYERTLFEASGIASCELCATSTRFLRVNVKFCNLVGYTQEELLGGLTILNITPKHQYDGINRALTSLLNRTRDSVEFEQQYLQRDGDVAWTYSTFTLFPLVNSHSPSVFIVAQNISEQKKVEEELRRSIDEIRQITEAAPVAIYVSHDPACKVIVGNSIAQELLEAAPEENVSAGSSFSPPDCAVVPHRRYFDSKGRQLSAAELPMQEAARENRSIMERTISVVMATGKRITLFGSAVPLRDGNGNVRGCVGAYMDLTARIESEQAFRDLQERMDLAVAASGVGYWDWDFLSDEVVLDKVSAQMFGCKTACTSTEVFANMSPEDRERVRKDVQATVEGLAPYQSEFRIQNGDTIPRWIKVLGDIYSDTSGRPVRMTGISLNISEAKKIEAERQRFEALAESSPVLMAINDLEHHPLFINKAGLKLCGFANMEEAQATPITDLLFPEDRDLIFNEFLPRVLDTGKGEAEVRLRNVRTGEYRWMSYNVFSLLDSGGSVICLATVGHDVTERKRAEDLLRAADRHKNDFLATLGHELRNPLGVISNVLELWSRVIVDPEKSAQLRAMMERQVKQVKRLIDDLLDVSRIGRGKIQLQKEPVDINVIVQNAIETAESLIHSNGHSLSLDLPAEKITVDGDKTRLIQVVVNLLNNAAKYTQPNGHIWVSAKVEGKEVFLAVRDDGCGIPKDMLSRIFEPFTQVERTLDRAQGGLGIGLKLVKSLVELHGGHVEARSDGLGQGAEFIVRLPIIDR